MNTRNTVILCATVLLAAAAIIVTSRIPTATERRESCYREGGYTQDRIKVCDAFPSLWK